MRNMNPEKESYNSTTVGLYANFRKRTNSNVHTKRLYYQSRVTETEKVERIILKKIFGAINSEYG